MRWTRLLPSLLILLLASVTATAADWPCWRGPDGSGVAPDCPPLIDDLGKARLLWTSEETRITSSYSYINGGAGGPVVADGRVYLTYQFPSGAVDEAAWEKNKGAGGGYLNQVLPLCMESYGMTREEVIKLKCMPRADDVVICIDARTGKTVWKRTFPDACGNSAYLSRQGKAAKAGPHNIPAVAYGKVVAVGGAGRVYGLDATSGETVWVKDHLSIKCGDRNNGAATFAGGAFVLARGGSCLGIDPRSGEIVWEIPKCLGNITNPIRWLPGDGKEYIIAGATCIDPQRGKALWTIDEAVVGNLTAPAVNDSYLVCAGDQKSAMGVNAWRITPQGYKKAWSLDPTTYPSSGYCAPVIMDGHAYVRNDAPDNRGQMRFICVALTSGKVTVTESFRSDSCASLIGGGGRLFFEGITITADPAKPLVNLGNDWAPGDFPANYSRSHTGCLVGGVLFVRGQTALYCYDLRAGR